MRARAKVSAYVLAPSKAKAIVGPNGDHFEFLHSIQLLRLNSVSTAAARVRFWGISADEG